MKPTQYQKERINYMVDQSKLHSCDTYNGGGQEIIIVRQLSGTLFELVYSNNTTMLFSMSKLGSVSHAKYSLAYVKP